VIGEFGSTNLDSIALSQHVFSDADSPVIEEHTIGALIVDDEIVAVLPSKLRVVTARGAVDEDDRIVGCRAYRDGSCSEANLSFLSIWRQYGQVSRRG
jgi:hypothetical protein